MYTFIYRTIRRHGYEDVTIPHRITSKNTITLLNFPYVHSHIQSHSPRPPPWPSSPAFCGLDLAVNQTRRFSRLAFLQREISTNSFWHSLSRNLTPKTGQFQLPTIRYYLAGTVPHWSNSVRWSLNINPNYPFHNRRVWHWSICILGYDSGS